MSSDAISRRRFMKVAGATTGSVAIHAMTSPPATGSVLGVNDRIQFGVILRRENGACLATDFRLYKARVS